MKWGRSVSVALGGLVLALVVTAWLDAHGFWLREWSRAYPAAPLLWSFVLTLIVAIAASNAESRALRERQLGNLLLVGLLCAAALVALAGWYHATNVATALSGCTRYRGWGTFEWVGRSLGDLERGTKRLLSYLLPLGLATVVAAVPHVRSLRPGLKQVAPLAAILAIGMSATMGIRTLLFDRDTPQLAQWSSERWPPDVAPSVLEYGDDPEGLDGPVILVGRGQLWAEERLGDTPQPLAPLAALEGPRCGDALAKTHRPSDKVFVAVDDSLTARHMACVMVGLQHLPSDTGQGEGTALPYGIVAGPRNPEAPKMIHWLVRSPPVPLPEPYRSLVIPYAAVDVMLQTEPSETRIEIGKDRWTLLPRNGVSELRGNLDERTLQLLAADHRWRTGVAVVAAPDTPAREVLAVASLLEKAWLTAPAS